MKTEETRKRSRPARGSSAAGARTSSDTAAAERKREKSQNGEKNEATEARVATRREDRSEKQEHGKYVDGPNEGKRKPAAGAAGGVQLLSPLREKWASSLRNEMGLTLGGRSTSDASDSSAVAGAHSCGVFELWAFCMHIASQRNEDKPWLVLEPIGLTLTGVFDLLAKQVMPGDETLAGRGRHFYDLPECLPVMESTSSPSSSLAPGYHLCLFRDREDQEPHAVVSNVPSEGPTFSVVCADPELLTLPDPPLVSRHHVEEQPRKQKGKMAGRTQELDAGASEKKNESAASVPLLLAALLLHCDRIVEASFRRTSHATKGRKKSRTVETKTENRSQEPEKQMNEHPVEDAKRIRSALVEWLNKEMGFGDVSLERIEANTQRWKQKRKKAIVSSDLSGKLKEEATPSGAPRL